MNEYLIEIANSTEARQITVMGGGAMETLDKVLDMAHGFLVMTGTILACNGVAWTGKLASPEAVRANLSGVLFKL
jgi:hypothetical protein